MSHRRVNRRAGAAAAAASTALLAGAILLPGANATPEKPSPAVDADGRVFSPAEAGRVGPLLAERLGAQAAGWYHDGAGRLVVNVLDDRDAGRVGDTGAVPKRVDHSTAVLHASARALAEDASVPGTAWSVDPRGNRVAVVADSTVTGARWDRLVRVTERLGDTVSVRRSTGTFTPFAGPVDGGDAVFGGGARCSLGFNVDAGGARAFLTAGHCGDAAATWSADPAGTEPLGTVTASVFPGDGDFALVAYDDPRAEAPSTVDLRDGTVREITRAVPAAVGMRVQRSGSTTGLSSGTVTGLDATVNYGNGDVVTGLVQSDVCAEPGDSGGPVFSGDAAVGLTSGGSGDCTRGGVTFFQPVTAALEAVGAEIDPGRDAVAAPGVGAAGRPGAAGRQPGVVRDLLK
ncbi:S1 family peptidase [Streptomyces chumphonensis]|uniref:S1 family peptidase n=1 Tax=Streptomyces chumphonensis TaxID=1214925 RepID=A0A927EX91_9ACTN|nr:alpha-lytic protease prodomain-containing protein [Streptomyces chumphonensis]MBD3931073.1 S1 family peptidase [Streptomyces chumphonensis]